MKTATELMGPINVVAVLLLLVTIHEADNLWDGLRYSIVAELSGSVLRWSLCWAGCGPGAGTITIFRFGSIDFCR